jgi:UDP-N-acetylmuramoyl-L-alanyl-D-glutamate--2,6-diaminopimelate ligase
MALVERAAANVTERPCTLPMLGRYNAWNAAGALAAARALGVDGGSAVRALERFAGVPGRLERVDAGQGFAVAVDYAHTPDALERALAACREHTAGRVLLVFGCGGDRDRGKRPLMGAAAARAADRAWVTNDNPRSEDPATIAAAILEGVPAGSPVEFNVVLDRRAAIAAALGAAGPGDLVLIAGKGHETTQTTAGVVTPFDDRQVARELLRAAAGGGRPTRAGVR